MTKYAAALIQIAIALVGALAVLKGPITLAAALQLVPLVANVIIVHLVPLFGPAMRSGWKTGCAIAVAVAAAAAPLVLTHHITGGQAIVVLLAGLQALGAHIGVQIRNDATSTATFVVNNTGTAAPITPVAAEPTTDTTVQKAIDLNSGEFIGEAAR